ncbi:unnamed protein product [Cochlearia groenlandica]
MTRQKVKMKFIENESARKTTYNKRKKGILKKAYELTTLCDVPIAVIIQSPYDTNQEVYPSKEAVEQVVSKFKMLSSMDKTKKMVNQETFLQQRIYKATEAYNKLKKENKELELKGIMMDCISGKTCISDSVAKEDMLLFGSVIEQHLKEVNRRGEILMRNNDVASSSNVVVDDVDVDVATTTTLTSNVVEIGSSSSSSVGLNLKETMKDLDLNKKQFGE